MASANHRDFVVQNRWDIKAGPPILYRSFRLRQGYGGQVTTQQADVRVG
jgi:hypothetical protein